MSWLTRLANTLRRGRTQSEIRREIAFHIAERTDDLQSAGLSRDEAARQARRQFGNVGLQAERTHDVDILLWADACVRNLRYAVRALRRAPVFALTAVLMLAVGIGANSAVFSAIHAVLLQPLPFPDGDRLVRVSQLQARSAETAIAPIRLEEWSRLNSSFDAITGYFVEDVSETSGDFPERIRRAWVAPRFLDVWGIAPRLGRGFTDAEHVAGGPFAVLLSDGYWRRRFGADPTVVGKTIRIGNASFPIVGVMPAAFLFPDRKVDMWFPSQMADWMVRARQATWYVGVGRLRPNVTPSQARANLAAVQAQLAERFPETDRTLGVGVAPLKDVTVQGVRASLWLLYGAVSLLLLITCTNIAALMLSRASHRQHEIAVRLSIGASRASVAGQLLTESAVLSIAGAAIGLLIAAGAGTAIRTAAADLPRVNEIALDAGILGYTLAAAIVAALVSGIFPVLRIGRWRLAGTANEGGRSQVSSRMTVQWLLVGTQVALSITLLAGAGLLVRSIQELSRVNPGFDPDGILAFRVSGTWNETANYASLLQRVDRARDELSGVPGVSAAATAGFLPGVPAQYESTFELMEAADPSELRIAAESRFVSPEYFATLRIPVLGGERCAGKAFDAPKEVMVNRAFVNRYLSRWPSVVGLHLAAGAAGRPARITGIVGDARERGLDRDPGPIVYTCFSAPNPFPYFLVRTRDDPAAAVPSIRRTLKEIEPFRAVYEIAPLDQTIGAAFTQQRLRTLLLVFFAATALLLACLGLYGTLSYIVTMRRREIGLRMALGAGRSDIVRHFVLLALRAVGIACVCGLALAVAFGRVLSGMLFGVSPSDPAILGGVIALVLTIATVAALVPSTRAAFLTPVRVLRED